MVTETVAHESEQGWNDFWHSDNTAITLTIFKWESGSFDYHVHGGEKSPIGHQDHGKARCLGQIQQNDMNEAEWMALAGRDKASTSRCVIKTQEILRYHAERCKLRRNIHEAQRWRAPLTENEVNLLLNAYGNGQACHVSTRKDVTDRIKTYKSLRKLL